MRTTQTSTTHSRSTPAAAAILPLASAIFCDAGGAEDGIEFIGPATVSFAMNNNATVVG